MADRRLRRTSDLRGERFVEKLRFALPGHDGLWRLALAARFNAMFGVITLSRESVMSTGNMVSEGVEMTSELALKSQAGFTVDQGPRRVESSGFDS